MDKAEVKKCKKTLNILKIAATDKENITSKIHKKKMNANNVKTMVAKKNKKNVGLDNRIVTKTTSTLPYIAATINNKNKLNQPSAALASDLVADNPSENYWKNLAESCRKALEAALKENVDLHNKVSELEYENSSLKAMLNDAKSLVEVLTEMIEENKDELCESTKGNAPEEAKEGEASDSDFENMSFQSCVQ